MFWHWSIVFILMRENLNWIHFRSHSHDRTGRCLPNKLRPLFQHNGRRQYAPRLHFQLNSNISNKEKRNTDHSKSFIRAKYSCDININTDSDSVPPLLHHFMSAAFHYFSIQLQTGSHLVSCTIFQPLHSLLTILETLLQTLQSWKLWEAYRGWRTTWWSPVPPSAPKPPQTWDSVTGSELW